MFCMNCGTQNDDNAKFCSKCGTAISSNKNIAAYNFPDTSFASGKKFITLEGIPEGVKGWSWGAFFLNWIWAIGNRTWWGLLAVIPYIGFIVAFWLGFKGREMAWKNRKWDNIDHFNRVQKKWSQWGVGLVLGIGLIGILAAIAVPAYQGYVKKAKAANQTSEINRHSSPMYSSTPEASSARSVNVIATKDNDELWEARLRATAADVNKSAPIIIDQDTRMDTSMAGPGRKFTYYYTLLNQSLASIDVSQIEKFSEVIKNRACTQKVMEEFFKNKTVVGYQYNDMDGKLITQIEVIPSDCGF